MEKKYTDNDEIEINADQRGVFEYDPNAETKEYIRLYKTSTLPNDKTVHKIQQQLLRYNGFTAGVRYNPYEKNPYHTILWRAEVINCALLDPGDPDRQIEGGYFSPGNIWAISFSDLKNAFREEVDAILADETFFSPNPPAGSGQVYYPFRCPWRERILSEAQAALGLQLSEREQVLVEQIIIGELSTFEAVHESGSILLSRLCTTAHEIAPKYEGANWEINFF